MVGNVAISAERDSSVERDEQSFLRLCGCGHTCISHSLRCTRLSLTCRRMLIVHIRHRRISRRLLRRHGVIRREINLLMLHIGGLYRHRPRRVLDMRLRTLAFTIKSPILLYLVLLNRCMILGIRGMLGHLLVMSRRKCLRREVVMLRHGRRMPSRGFVHPCKGNRQQGKRDTLSPVG